MTADCLPPASRDFLERALVRICHASLMEWMVGEIQIDMAHRDVGLTVAILLGAYVREDRRTHLDRVRRSHQRQTG